MTHELAWQEWAACKDEPINTFYTSSLAAETAKAICARCLVAKECLVYALNNDEPDGVWGGKTRQERRELLRLSRAAGRLAAG